MDRNKYSVIGKIWDKC